MPPQSVMGIDLLFYMYMMFIPHREHMPPQSATGRALHLLIYHKYKLKIHNKLYCTNTTFTFIILQTSLNFYTFISLYSIHEHIGHPQDNYY
jgi:hypothetical protein